ncbi:hypothetical protein P43SY_004446 [Pythium insidiosum]|uniref:PX domain-containing protein n=1 Tax=Pythium insidiosum TaxID=114742 RepID=A0AAD5LMV4_PYTIN|nr:hypothetical protein P43SY_004446 [Pythium insidiosum]KAJ0407793.1 hypothetical protein ATCC90586_006269 [Pythium insidiosum]
MIPRLVPVAMEPHRQSGAAAPLAALGKIDRVQISDVVQRRKGVYFVMDVYLRNIDSRLPLTSSLRDRIRLRPSASESRAPDYQVEARFSDFAGLRADVSEWMCMNARFTCEYCNNFEEYIRFRVKQPRWIVKISTRVEQRKRILESFINDFIHMAQMRVPACDKCRAHEYVPFLVEAFVRKSVRPSTELERTPEAA